MNTKRKNVEPEAVGLVAGDFDSEIDVAPAPMAAAAPPAFVAEEGIMIPLMDVAAPADEAVDSMVCEFSAGSGVAFSDVEELELSGIAEMERGVSEADSLAITDEDLDRFMEEIVTDREKLQRRREFEAAKKEALAEFDAALEGKMRAAGGQMKERIAAALPSTACLYPYEIEEYARTGRLSAARREHVDGCPACAAVLKVQRHLHEADEASTVRWELLAALAAKRV